MQRIDTFLTLGDEATLLEGNFWRREHQDGRSSQAMLGLLREVRRMRQAGFDVRVLTMDVPSSGEGSQQDRDEHMAARVAQVRAQAPTEPMVLMVGNLRPRVTQRPRARTGETHPGVTLRDNRGVRRPLVPGQPLALSSRLDEAVNPQQSVANRNAPSAYMRE